MNIINKKISFNRLEKMLEEKNLISFNRKIENRHVKKMTKSILQCGVLRDPVIGDISLFDKKRKYVLIDAQHLTKAIITSKFDNKKPINCKVKKYNNMSEVINDIAILNNTQKKWNDNNFLLGWYNYGNDNLYWKNYSELYRLNFEVFTELPLGVILNIYTNNKKNFKLGKLKFYNKEFSDDLIVICNILKVKYNKPSHTITGLIMWAKNKKNIDFIKLNSRLEICLQNKEDQNCNGRDDFKNFVEIIYNRV